MDKHAGKVWTYDDLASLPDDGQRYEILDGQLVVSPSPRSAHQRVLLRLVKQLLALEASGQGTVWLSPIDVKMSDTRVVVPDLLAIRTERAGIVGERGIEAAPDLVVEILSPSNRKHDLVAKRRFYARVGVPEYWIVDPDAESVEVLELAEDARSFRPAHRAGPGERVRSRIFDLDVDVAALFRD